MKVGIHDDMRQAWLMKIWKDEVGSKDDGL